MDGSHPDCLSKVRTTAPLLRRSVVATSLVGAAVALTAQVPSPGHDYPKDDTAASWDMFQRAKMSEYRAAPHRPRPRFAATVEEFPIQLPPGKELGRTLGVSRAPNGDIYLIQWSDRGVYIRASLRGCGAHMASRLRRSSRARVSPFQSTRSRGRRTD